MRNKNKVTKFPVARIKKIMQKDEEVGKVAQATPILISKALELFMGSLVEEMTKVAVQRSIRRVEIWHLKHAIEQIDTFDFLREIVQPIPDPTNGGVEEETSTEPKRRKKRAKVDDDD
ncbi:hypothetical protein BOTBODRAFT_36830 [Botryobasidium botryosum FD-172 SS1]|uniref:Transcription factor CBF/NF-Y/archaeal histone domain-containing protein n=1 Tax=Botryobasidium botryosum (strain FD-172 SS1) TaxID=930990 RepID=A0A067M2F1_BOTB1|nr:hypothetical protein BOTBODRAFT_36830 [Botryobasidium botryosum FD-172 SS1]